MMPQKIEFQLNNIKLQVIEVLEQDTIFKVQVLGKEDLYILRRVQTQYPKELKNSLKEIQTLKSSYLVDILEIGEEKTINHDQNIILTLETYYPKIQILEPLEACQCILHLAQGLKDLQEKNLMHRSIDPDSAIFDIKTKIYRLRDFSNVKQIPKQKIRQSYDIKKNELSQQFMAPEILVQEPYTNSCDIWSLGCLWYYFSRAETIYDKQRFMDEVCKLIYQNKSIDFKELYGYSDICQNLLSDMLKVESERRDLESVIISLKCIINSITNMKKQEQIKIQQEWTFISDNSLNSTNICQYQNHMNNPSGYSNSINIKQTSFFNNSIERGNQQIIQQKNPDEQELDIWLLIFQSTKDAIENIQLDEQLIILRLQMQYYEILQKHYITSEDKLKQKRRQLFLEYTRLSHQNSRFDFLDNENLQNQLEQIVQKFKILENFKQCLDEINRKFNQN